jgi:hypothetical protein
MPDLKTKAVLTPKTDERGRNLTDAQKKARKVDVFFNPETLDLTLTNSIQKGNRRRPAQTVTESTAKLSMDLIFDTTMDGKDVREHTHKVAQMMDPVQTRTSRGGRSRQQNVPAIVIFEWATIKFEGYIDSYKENIDFFSSEGVPLRATINLSLTQQERTFAPTTGVNFDSSGVMGQPSFGGGGAPATGGGSGGGGGGPAPSGSDTQTKKLGDRESITDAAQTAGDPAATRRLAAQNGIENLRMPGVDEIAVVDELARGAASFSAGASLSGGLGLDASIDLKAQATALSSATGSAFAGLNLQASAQIPRPRAKLSLDIDTPPGADIGIGVNADFGAGGEIASAGGASMSADVGVNADFDAGITFEE